MDEWHRWMDGQTGVGGWVNWRMDGQRDGWMNGWVGGWMNEWIDG